MKEKAMARREAKKVGMKREEASDDGPGDGASAAEAVFMDDNAIIITTTTKFIIIFFPSISLALLLVVYSEKLGSLFQRLNLFLFLTAWRALYCGMYLRVFCDYIGERQGQSGIAIVAKQLLICLCGPPPFAVFLTTVFVISIFF